MQAVLVSPARSRHVQHLTFGGLFGRVLCSVRTGQPICDRNEGETRI